MVQKKLFCVKKSSRSGESSIDSIWYWNINVSFVSATQMVAGQGKAADWLIGPELLAWGLFPKYLVAGNSVHSSSTICTWATHHRAILLLCMLQMLLPHRIGCTNKFMIWLSPSFTTWSWSASSNSVLQSLSSTRHPEISPSSKPA